MLSFVQTQFLALSSLFVSSDLCQAQGCRSWSVDEGLHLFAHSYGYLQLPIIKYLDILIEKLYSKGSK